MDPMVLAVCINPAASENSLLLGEYYVLRWAGRKQHPSEPGLHQGNVMAYYVSDEYMRPELFLQPIPNGFFEPSPDLRNKLLAGTPVYIGPKARFDIMDTESQLKTATHKASERLGFSKGKR